MYWPALIITAILLAGYCWLIRMYRQWFLRLPVYNTTVNAEPLTCFSVIIPARDEEANIANCLRSVLEQAYPSGLMEVIVVNDFSTDRTAEIVKEWQQQYPQLRLINMADRVDGQGLNSYKKKAIGLAVGESRYPWIVTTDADCYVSKGWLKTLDLYIREKQPVFVAAPVMFANDGSFLSVFQVLDFISLQGITAAAVSAGSHTMCNGANIAYRKDVFDEVGQFSGIDAIASGDDMLLMHKIKMAYPKNIGYLFSQASIVITEPMKSWKEFINQRIRWASKADKYTDRSIFWVLALVYALNFALVVMLVMSVFTGNGWIYWLLLLITKTLVELSFMLPVARFFEETRSLLWFPWMQPLHILYTVLAGWLGKFGSYRWKKRKVK